MVLAQALHTLQQTMDTTYDPSLGHILPSLPLHRARFLMTRSDFIRRHHELSIFAIDAHAMVRADSVPMQRAFNDVCSEPGFGKFLDATLERIAGIESLGRTKELTLKDLWEGGRYKVTTRNVQGEATGSVEVESVGKPGDGDDEDGDDE